LGASRSSALFLAVLAILALSLNSPAEQRIEAVPRGDVITLSEAARFFGATVSWKPAEGKIVLAFNGSEAQILLGSNRILIGDYVLTISAPVHISDGLVRVGVQDAAALFSRLLQREVTASELLAAGLAAQPETARRGITIEDVHYISYPEFTRFIINLRGAPDVETVKVQCVDEHDLSVIFSDARFSRLEPPVDINDGVIARLEFLQADHSSKLLIKTQAKRRTYEMQRYNDPPRIVVDVLPDEPLVTTLGQRTVLPQPNGLTEIEPEPQRERLLLTTVVIDPGHGGKDVGARGAGGLMEKEVVLDIALRLKKLIEQKDGMKVVLTRNSDYFVSLEERTMIANSAKEGAPADLFISIHTNSHKSPKIGGFEAYYISDAVDPGAEATAALENAVVAFEKQGKGPAPDSLVPILWDLQFMEFISQSSELAFIAQEQLANRLNTRNRGVRQARFIVLSGVAMPSVLIEVGFISNRVEEAKMKTPDFKERCAEAVSAAVLNFKERHDVRLGLLKKDAKH